MLSRPEIRHFQVLKVALDKQKYAQAAPECIALGTADGMSVALKYVQTCQTVLPTHLAQAIVKTVIRCQMRRDLPEYQPKQPAGFHGIFISG